MAENKENEVNNIESEESTLDAKGIERQIYKKYWADACETFGLTTNGMLLSPEIQNKIDELDRDEILDHLKQNIKSKSRLPKLVELAAGIGRFTPYLLELCDQGVIVDFIQEYIDKNRQCHGQRVQDTFVCSDALTVNFSPQSIDILFWNWLLLYVQDNELESFLERVLGWIKPGGYFFCRESCDAPSNKFSRAWAKQGNPSKYRPAATYTRLLTTAAAKHPGAQFKFLIKEVSVKTYAIHMNQENQRMWMLHRTI